MALISLQIILFLTGLSLQAGICKECQQLETGDISEFDTRKYEGEFEMVLTILDEKTLAVITLNCNRVTWTQHPHPNGGINVAIAYENGDEQHAVVERCLPHFNSSTDIYPVEIAKYDRHFQKWIDVYYKIILATDDIIAYTTCINNEDNEADVEFLLFVLRKSGSKLTSTEIREMLPESIKKKPEILEICNH